MGYVHHYDVNGWRSEEWQRVWPKLIEDVRLILQAADVPLCGSGGSREHLSPIEPPIVDVVDGIYFNGVWDDGHEPFVLSESDHHTWCKVSASTATQKPYGVVVACVLLRAYRLAPDHVEAGSDGNWNSSAWDDARQLYHSIWPDESIRCPWAAEGMSNDETSQTVFSSQLSIERPRDCSSYQTQATAMQNLNSSRNDPGCLPRDAPTTVSEYDFSPIREWLSLCESAVTHGSCHGQPLEVRNLPGVVFRLIDVRRRCVVIPDTDVPFITLTYVWGGVEQLKLQYDTEAALMREGGLDALWSMLSTTIRDAIIVCEKLNERYLWTDSLCIVQDSIRDMKIQITWMRQIYSAAKCGLAAVSAETSNVGLLGCKAVHRKVPSTEAELADLIRISPWSARAWCYQEKVLSHKLILFTSAGIFMQCQDSSYDANGVELAGNRHQGVEKYESCGGMLYLSPIDDPLESYLCAVEHYSQRKLSKQEDRIYAFAGILQRYQQGYPGGGFSFLYGLPVVAFDQVFCWRSEHHDQCRRNVAFPSWSWIGWTIAVTFDSAMLQQARTNQMLYRNSEQYKSTNDDWKAMLELRKPANSGFLPPEDIENARFGFPATQSANASDSQSLWIDASVAILLIAPTPTASNGSQSYYAVFATRCSQQPAPPPPKTITLWDSLHLPMPKLNFMDEETAAAPSVPAARPVDENYDITEHDQHTKCEAQSPIGYIWLHREWREKQSQACTMEFMAIHGERNADRPGQWTIKMLMLLQKMEKNGHFWAHERVQVMDCEIEQHLWLKIRANTVYLKLV